MQVGVNVEHIESTEQKNFDQSVDEKMNVTIAVLLFFIGLLLVCTGTIFLLPDSISTFICFIWFCLAGFIVHRKFIKN